MTRLGVALEITPPASWKPDVLQRRARLLGPLAESVHVIQRSGRVPSLEAALGLQSTGLDAVWHLCVHGRGRAELDAEIARAAAGGARAALVVRGESDALTRPDTPRQFELVAELRRALPGARVGVTLNPYLEREPQLRRLFPKLDAGASFVQTQPLFGLDALAPYAEAIRARAPRARIVPMLIPLVSVAAAVRLGERLRLPIPDALLRALERGGEEAGWEAFTTLLRRLARSGLADGVALMTLEMDPPKVFAERIARALGPSGAPG